MGQRHRPPILTLVVPVLDHDRSPIGVVAADLDMRALSGYLGRIPLIHGTSAAILTDAGVVVARSGAGRRVPDADVGAASATLPALGQRGAVAEWRGDDGIASAIAAAPVSRAPWMVLAAVARGLAYVPAAARLRGSLAGLGAVTRSALLVHDSSAG